MTRRVVYPAVWVTIAFLAGMGLSCTGAEEASVVSGDVEPTEAQSQGSLSPHIGYPPEHPSASLVDDLPGSEDFKIGQPPEVFGVDPAEGTALGGEIVTINGAHFMAGAEVYFGDVPATDVFYINESWLNVTTPVSSPGIVAVRVENPDGGEGEQPNAFLFYDDLEVHSVSPAAGSPLGGELVTISGRGFEPGVLVLFGSRLAMDVQVKDGNTLAALTPPGHLGAVTVRVVIEGQKVAVLPEGYRYASGPDIDSVWPPHGPTIGGTDVEVMGRFFTLDMEVTLGGKPAEVLTVGYGGQQAVIRTPGGAAGPVDLSLSNEEGTSTLPGAFTYLAPATGGIVPWSIQPATGSASGGYTVNMVVQGLEPDLPVGVRFDGAEALNVQTGLYPDTLFVEVPPGAVGLVSVEVGQQGEWVSVPGGFLYTQPLSLSGVAPEEINQAGGTAVTFYGEGFESATPDELSFLVGPYPATDFEVLSDGQVLIQAPACPPGPLDVTVIAGDRSATLKDALQCVADEPHVYALDPPDVSQAGGAIVQIIGAGLPMNPSILFGDKAGTETQWESSEVIWTRVPQGEPGGVSLQIQSPELAAPVTMLDAVKYFDPANKKAGVWGPLIDRTLNVSVFNGSNGKRIEAATAILGADPETKYQCVTDERGQCTISYFELSGPQQITAAKDMHSAYTIAGVGGTNVTIYIRPQSPPPQQGPPGAGVPISINELVGNVQGTVNGLGKYVMPPPPDCDVIGSPDGEQCTPCDALTACPGDLQCLPLAEKGSFCVKSCTTSADCADGFACASLGGGPVCIPHGGEISGRCATSRRSFFGSNPDPGPGSIVDPANATFDIVSRMGEVTIYCMGGYTHPTTGQFIATVMGMTPTVVVPFDGIVTNVDVTLNIPLTRTLRLRVFDLPVHPEPLQGVVYRNAVDIGAEGWIPFAETPTIVDGEMHYFVGYPESLAPFGKDAAYTFYSSIRTQTAPYVNSYVMNYRLDSVDTDPIRIRGAETGEWDETYGGMRGDLNGIWGTGPDDVFGVGPGGRMVHRGPLGWSPQPKFTDVDLHAIWGEAANDIRAVGAKGTILHYDGVNWETEATVPNVAWDLHDIDGRWIVGEGGILRKSAAGWTEEPVLHSSGLRGVVDVSAEYSVAVGAQGRVLHWDGVSWTAELVSQSSADLYAVACDGSTLVAVGDGGVILMRPLDGTQWTRATSPTKRDLRTVTAGEGGTFYAAGTTGVVLRYDPIEEAWLDDSDRQTAQMEFQDLWFHEGAVYGAGYTAVPGGPWMAFPDAINPRWYDFFEKDRMEWEFGPGGPDPTFNSAYMSSSDGFTVWAIVSAGPISRISLPPLTEVIGYDPIPEGMKYFNVTRALNPEFSMDSYRFSHLSVWRRTTWSTTYGSFY